jgi:cytochrome c5
MTISRRRIGFKLVALTALTLLTLAGLVLAQEEDEVAKKARLAKLDAGPKKIDVTKYPADMQAGYAVFTKKCAKCHTPARPINSRFVLPGEWERYIKRMVYKPDSKMTDADGKTIYHFLVYDSSVRKADSLRVHLGNLPGEEREAAVAKIKAINPSFEPSGK